MLIEFSVANFKSIKEKQTLSMVAANWIKEHPQNVIATHDQRLLASVGIYGANAAGKSNFIDALLFVEWFVTQSQQKRQQGDVIDKIVPFLFDQHKASSFSEFEILFIEGDTRYNYIFAVNEDRVTYERLIAYPKGRQQLWFERTYNDTSGKYQWYFNPTNFKGSGDEKKLWQDTTRDNSLFLSAAIQCNNDQLAPVFFWFKEKLVTNQLKKFLPSYTSLQWQEGKMQSEILELVKDADTSIDSIEIIKIPIDKFPKEMQKEVQAGKLKLLSDDIMFKHRGSTRLLSFIHESDGTRKMFSLAGPIVDVLQQGKILVIDEIDNSLHPLLVRRLIELFHNKKINQHKAQLVFSTHDTSVLDRHFLRRDQIWFVEKNLENATELYPLSDFKIRNDEAFGKGYLQGRYGAIPYFVGELPHEQKR